MVFSFARCSRVARKAWRYTEWGKEEGGKRWKEMDVSFEALLDGATNKCFRVSYTDRSIMGGDKAEKKKRRRSGSLNRSGGLNPNGGLIQSGALIQNGGLIQNGRLIQNQNGEMVVNGEEIPNQNQNHSGSLDQLAQGRSLMAFMRVQGAGSVLSNAREQEMAIFQCAAREGLGARLYGVFENGYVAEYVKGRVVKVEEMREERMVERIGKLVARWHSLSIPSSISVPHLFPLKGRKPLKSMSLRANTFMMIDKWLARAKRLYSSEDALALSRHSPPTFHAFSHELALTKLDILPFYALPHASNVLCHNDLNHGNLLFNPDAPSNLTSYFNTPPASIQDTSTGLDCPSTSFSIRIQKAPSLATQQASPFEQFISPREWLNPKYPVGNKSVSALLC